MVMVIILPQFIRARILELMTRLWEIQESPNIVFKILHMCLYMHFSVKGVHKTFIDLFFDIRIKYSLTLPAVFSFSLRKCT